MLILFVMLMTMDLLYLRGIVMTTTIQFSPEPLKYSME